MIKRQVSGELDNAMYLSQLLCWLIIVKLKVHFSTKIKKSLKMLNLSDKTPCELDNAEAKAVAVPRSIIVLVKSKEVTRETGGVGITT